jgi:ABC-type phosphate transport system substrate-binding protein
MVLREFVLGPVGQFAITPRAASLNQESDMVDGLVNTQATIGYLSLGYALFESLPIHLLQLDGVEPSPANVDNGTYEMTRALGVVVKPDAPEAVLAFVDYLTSEEARAAMSDYYAPGPD